MNIQRRLKKIQKDLQVVAVEISASKPQERKGDRGVPVYEFSDGEFYGYGKLVTNPTKIRNSDNWEADLRMTDPYDSNRPALITGYWSDGKWYLS